jgi:hypothetical protein
VPPRFLPASAVVFFISCGASLGAEPAGPQPGDSIQIPSAVEARAGEEYGAGTRIRVGAAGVSFVVPQGWVGGMPPDSQVLILGSPSTPGFGMMFFLIDVSTEDIEAHMSAVQPIAHDLIFEPAGPVSKTGGRLAAAYTGAGMIGRALALVGPSRNGVLYFFGSLPDEVATLGRLLEELAASTVFDGKGPSEPPTS